MLLYHLDTLQRYAFLPKRANYPIYFSINGVNHRHFCPFAYGLAHIVS